MYHGSYQRQEKIYDKNQPETAVEAMNNNCILIRLIKTARIYPLKKGVNLFVSIADYILINTMIFKTLNLIKDWLEIIINLILSFH